MKIAHANAVNHISQSGVWNKRFKRVWTSKCSVQMSSVTLEEVLLWKVLSFWPNISVQNVVMIVSPIYLIRIQFRSNICCRVQRTRLLLLSYVMHATGNFLRFLYLKYECSVCCQLLRSEKQTHLRKQLHVENGVKLPIFVVVVSVTEIWGAL